MKSKFTGSAWDYFGMCFFEFVVVSLTFGIAYPWVACFYQRWLASNSVIDGRRIYFDGKGGELALLLIKWLLLIVLTLGLYSFKCAVNMKNWLVSHTHFVNESSNEKNRVTIH